MSKPFKGGAFFLKSLDVRAARVRPALPVVSMGAHQWRANQRVALRYIKRASGNVLQVTSRQSGSSPGARINSIVLRANTNYRVVLVGRRVGGRKFYACPWVADRRGKDLVWGCSNRRTLASGTSLVSVNFRTGRERRHNVGALFSSVKTGDKFEVVSFHIERR